VEQRGTEAAFVLERGGHVHDGVLHRRRAAHAAHARVLHGQVQRPQRAHEERGGVACRGRRQAHRRRMTPDHPHLQLLLEAPRGRAHGGVAAAQLPRRDLLLGIGLQLLHATAQLGDVGGGVGEQGRLVHPGHRRHRGPEVAEPAVELLPPLPLGLDVADSGVVGPGPGLPAPPTPRRAVGHDDRSHRRVAGQVGARRVVRASGHPLRAIMHVLIIECFFFAE